jgi:hypothetical protein
MTLREFLAEWWAWLTTVTWFKIQVIQAAPLDAPVSFYLDVLGAAAIWLVIGWLLMIALWGMWNTLESERAAARAAAQRYPVDDPDPVCRVCYRRGCAGHEVKP